MSAHAATASALKASGVWGDLLKRFGPILAELILKFLASRQEVAAHMNAQSPAGAAAGTPGADMLRHFVAGILRNNKDAILVAIQSQIGGLYDQAVDALDA